MSKQDLNFEEDSTIDLDELHIEWAKQPRKRKKYADEVSFLEDSLKKIHQQEKVIRSKLILEAKEKGHSNATLQEAYYRTQNEHENIKKDKIKLEYDLSMAWNALKTIDDVKHALEYEVKLWTNTYFATPREHRDVESGKIMSKEIAGQKTETQRTEINARRRRKK
ncbi:MAG TPA: hypothetical protein VMV95_01100 [Bacillota bacterium]|nr:hypothetical protein [Bacillota bacterium]